MSNDKIHRGTGLLVLEVINSNPNGDPDREGEPRTRANGVGEISPVSVKRKLRDLIENKQGLVWETLKKAMQLDDSNFNILESQSTKSKEVENLAKTDEGKETLRKMYWDVRLFGTTYLQKDTKQSDKKDEDKKDDTEKTDKGNRFIHSGIVQFALGTSLLPVKIERMTNTRKANPEEDKSGGMAPMGYRIVEHGVYTIPFFVNPNDTKKMGTSEKDIELMLKLLPHAYKFTRSAVRPQVEVRHVWYAKHTNPLGSVNDLELIDQLKPKPELNDKESRYSTSWADYNNIELEKIKEKFGDKIILKDYANCEK